MRNRRSQALETDWLIRKEAFHETTDDRSRACGAVFQRTGFCRVEERERRCQEQSYLVGGEEQGQFEAIIAELVSGWAEKRDGRPRGIVEVMKEAI